MDVQDESVLDVDLLADDGSEEEGEAPPSSGKNIIYYYELINKAQVNQKSCTVFFSP